MPSHTSVARKTEIITRKTIARMRRTSREKVRTRMSISMCALRLSAMSAPSTQAQTNDIWAMSIAQMIG